MGFKNQPISLLWLYLGCVSKKTKIILGTEERWDISTLSTGPAWLLPRHRILVSLFKIIINKIKQFNPVVGASKSNNAWGVGGKCEHLAITDSSLVVKQTAGSIRQVC